MNKKREWFFSLSRNWVNWVQREPIHAPPPTHQVLGGGITDQKREKGSNQHPSRRSFRISKRITWPEKELRGESFLLWRDREKNDPSPLRTQLKGGRVINKTKNYINVIFNRNLIKSFQFMEFFLIFWFKEQYYVVLCFCIFVAFRSF